MLIGREVKLSCLLISSLLIRCTMLMAIWLFSKTTRVSQQRFFLRMAAQKCRYESNVHLCAVVTSFSTVSQTKKLVYRSVRAETLSLMGKARANRIQEPCSLQSFLALRRSSHRRRSN